MMTSLSSLLTVFCWWFVVQGIQPLQNDASGHAIHKRQAANIRIQFTEQDYETNEAVGFVTVIVQVDGATSQTLTIQLTPVNISTIRSGSRQDIISSLPSEDMRRPTTAISGLDFLTDVINYQLLPSTSISRFESIRIPIIDDNIDEEKQVFGVQLVVIGPLEVDTSFRNLTLIEITDDDEIILAWEFPAYIFNETLRMPLRIIKAENTMTELTLNFVIQAVSVSTNVSGSARIADDYTFGPPDSSITEEIEPNEQYKDIFVIIIPELRFEGDEVFELRLSNALNGLPFLTTVNGTSRDVTTITIIDRIEVGFIETSLNVTEGQEAKICIEENGPLDGPSRIIGIDKTVFLGILTVNGTAGDDDYTKVGKVDENILALNAKPVNESHCFLLNITDDNIVEGVEQFNVTLHIAVNDPILQKSVIIKPDTIVVTIIDNDDDITPIIVNDTVIGDPLLTVPINVINLESGNFTSNLSLCFELHGEQDQYFNLVSDQCVSVNSHYAAVDVFNIIDVIAVRAVDENGACRDIMVSITPGGYIATLDGVELTANVAMDSISIRIYSSRVRISVPNCDDQQLVMWVLCLNQTLEGYDRNDNLTKIEARLIKFVIARGLNLKETSHGILGQFWNVPLSVQQYQGPLNLSHASNYYNVTIIPPNAPPRSFPGFLWSVAWEYSTTGERQPCLYAGTKNAGRTSEIAELTGSVIEGFYLDYVIDEAFGTNFKYSQFSETCPTNIV